MLSDNGGKPACFLEVGGGATTDSVKEAVEATGANISIIFTPAKFFLFFLFC